MRCGRWLTGWNTPAAKYRGSATRLTATPPALGVTRAGGWSSWAGTSQLLPAIGTKASSRPALATSTSLLATRLAYSAPSTPAGSADWFDRCSVALADFEYVVDPRGFEPLTF